METDGFYKNDNGTLLHARDCVLSSDYELRRETRDTHTYPVDGWQWFESEDEARVHFNLPPADLSQQPL